MLFLYYSFNLHSNAILWTLVFVLILQMGKKINFKEVKYLIQCHKTKHRIMPDFRQFHITPKPKLLNSVHCQPHVIQYTLEKKYLFIHSKSVNWSPNTRLSLLISGIQERWSSLSSWLMELTFVGRGDINWKNICTYIIWNGETKAKLGY